MPGAVLQPSDAIGDTVQLVIGPGYSTVVPVTIGAPAVEHGAGGDGGPGRAARPGAGDLLSGRAQPKRPEM